MIITIDGNRVPVKMSHKTIVDVAADNGIGIPAPCYRQQRKFGCCNGCVIRVDGVEKFACVTKPVDGMVIEVKADDLVAIRKDRLLTYKKAIESGETLPCDCGDDCSDDSCGCDCDC